MAIVAWTHLTFLVFRLNDILKKGKENRITNDETIQKFISMKENIENLQKDKLEQLNYKEKYLENQQKQLQEQSVEQEKQRDELALQRAQQRRHVIEQRQRQQREQRNLGFPPLPVHNGMDKPGGLPNVVPQMANIFPGINKLIGGNNRFGPNDMLGDEANALLGRNVVPQRRHRRALLSGMGK